MTRIWTPQQEAVFDWFSGGSGNLVVQAVAGSGKTSVVIEGLSRAPERFGGRTLLAAFNKRIATELSERAPSGVTVRTLHAVGLTTINRTRRRVEIDETRGRRIAEAACGGNAPSDAVYFCSKLVAAAKAMMVQGTVSLTSLAYLLEVELKQSTVESGWNREALAEAAAEGMRLSLEDDGCVDFNDMIYVPVALGLKPVPQDLVVIDELQDLSMSQLHLATSCLSPNSRAAGVGDVFQMIMGFAFAQHDGMRQVCAAWNAAELPLSVTFRCPLSVVRMAQAYVSDFHARPDAPEGDVRPDATMAELVKEAVPGDFVVSRSNVGATGACLALLRAGKRACVIGKEVGRNLIELVDRLTEDGCGMGELHKRLAAWCERERERALAHEKFGRAQHVLDQKETLDVLSDGLATVQNLRARIYDLFEDTAGDGRIACSTCHRVKGLESRTVWVLAHTFRSTASREEENLKYVTITRSMERLRIVGGPEGSRPHPFRAAIRRLTPPKAPPKMLPPPVVEEEPVVGLSPEAETVLEE